MILSTVLMISVEYGAPDIDPLHVELLMEHPVYTSKSTVVLYLQDADCGFCPRRGLSYQSCYYILHFSTTALLSLYHVSGSSL